MFTIALKEIMSFSSFLAATKTLKIGTSEKQRKENSHDKKADIRRHQPQRI